MPAYLVTIPSDKATNFGADSVVVFAADEAGARAMAAGRFDGDSNAFWQTLATVTQITEGSNLDSAGDGFTLFCRISGGVNQTVDPIKVVVDTLNNDPAAGIKRARDSYHIGEDPDAPFGTITINDGGMATYVTDQILTVAGGTFTRAATLRITSTNTGVIDAVELQDPGDYQVLPTLTANPVTGGSGSGALMDLIAAPANSYEVLLARLVSALNAQPDIDNASLDMSIGASGPRILVLATGSGGDNLGDATVEIEIRQNNVAVPDLFSTIEDGGITTDPLRVNLPTPANTNYPWSVPFKRVV